MGQIFVGSGGTPAGTDTQIQFNNAGSFAGTTKVLYDVVNSVIKFTDVGAPNVNYYVGAVPVLAQMQMNGTGAASSIFGLSRFSVDTACPRIIMGKARNAAIGTFTAVASGDTLGEVIFNGADGTNFVESAKIQCLVTGTVGAGTVGSSLSFQFETSERMRMTPTALQFLTQATNGVELFNTTDLVTNTERLRSYWSGNAAHIITDTQGTGTQRELRIGTFNSGVAQNTIRVFGSAGTPFVRFTNAGSTNTSFVGWDFVNGTLSASSGTQTLMSLSATINQSGTAGYTSILVNITETATGSGTKNLLNLQVGGASRYSITNLGIPLYTPSATQTLLAANAISKDRGMIKVQGNGGAVTLTSAPTIAAGVEGEVIFIVGQSNANTVTVQDRGTLASSNLRLATTTRTLGNGDVLALVYDGAFWSEMYYSNNL